MSKIFTVFGATGNQGGSVVKNVLEHPELSKTYQIRAITRDVSKPAAIALKEKGCQVVTADLNDKASVVAAIKGSSVVFGVTDFWIKMSEEIEIQQGKNIADGCKEAGVERFVWSSLVNVTKETQGKISTVHHFDSKAKVEEYVRSIGVPGTFVMPGLFMSYMLNTAMKKNDAGTYVLTTPFPPDQTKIPLFDPGNDMGLFTAAALLLGQETINKRILCSSGYVTPNEIISTFSAVTGSKAVINKITFEQFHAAFPPMMADELTGNFQLVVDPGYYAGEPADGVDKSIKMVAKAGLRKPVSWKEYVETNAGKA